MKQLRYFMIAAILCLLTTIPVHAAVVGEVLSTNIGTMIDDMPISSYNINDYTYIIAEDLRGYGFDVVWDGEARTLHIHHDVHKGYQLPLDKERINIKKAEIVQRQHLYDVLETDIKTYLEGQEITAYNIDGQTMIQVDHLAQYGTFSYDDSRRMVEIFIAKPSFEYGLKIIGDAQEISFEINPARYRTTVHYMGRLQDGKPCGIGKLTNAEAVTYAYWEGEGEFNYPLYYGLSYYEGYNPISDAYSRRYAVGTRRVTVGEIQYDLTVLGKGRNPGYTDLTERTEWQTKVVDDGYVDGSSNAGRLRQRIGIYDPAYLYGFYIDKEVVYDAEGSAINYENPDLPRFTEVMSDKVFRQQAFVKAEDGTVYTAGFNGSGAATGIGDAAAHDGGLKVFTKTTNSELPRPTPETAVQNVVQWASADEAAYDRLVTLTDTGEVYFERKPGTWDVLTQDQRDHLDLSTPVRIFENAKYAGLQVEDVGVVTNYGYIPYFYVVDENDDLWFWNYEYYRQNKTGNEYDENNGYIVYGRVPYIKEPTKLMSGVKKAFGTEEKYILKTDGTLWRMNAVETVQILNGVKDMDADHCGRNYVAVKEDGSLWTWGWNQNGQCGQGHTEHVWNPTQVMAVYDYHAPEW